MCYITYSFIKRNEWGHPLFIIEWGEKMELLESIKEMVLPLIEQNDCYLDDIEYVKDNNEMYLRIYIEKNEGYLDMDTCVAVSELISDKLDETDPIKDEYILEVSSPGIEKPLKTFEQVQKSVGEYVYAKFKNPKAGLYEVEGYLKSVDNQELEFEYLVKNIKKKIVVNYDNIQFIRLAVKFWEEIKVASNRKFMSALNALCEEKGIEKDVFLEMLKESIAKAYKKNYMVPEANVRVEINEKTGKIRLFEIRTVVDDLEDEDLEVSLDEAHDINPNYQVGDIVETEADVDHIGRLAAIQTKQLFRQKIRETEKETLYNEFADKKDDIITGIVDRVEPKFAIINIGKTGAFLGLNQQIPGETLHEGQHVKVYVSDVDRGTKGTHIVVSRTEPQFVRRLFELEVPEVYDGTVEIKSVSREPGERSKIAVYTAVEGLDPIGSCVGPKGSRVKNVVDELHGEMIDIVEWSSDPVVYISHALSPSDVLTVSVDEEKHSALVIVPDDQLSLAIGKRGQNARLAVRLTGWKIDIKSLSEATELGLMEKIQQKEELPVDETFQDEFAQEMLDNQEEKETVVEEKENIKNEVEEVTSESDVEDYEDFDDYEDDEYSKYDEDIDYDEYDKYYDED